MHWLMLNDVKIQKKNSKRILRVGKLKILCHQPVGKNLIVTRSDDPYVVEVEPEVKKKETKLKLKTIKELEKEKEKEKIGVFDPRAHILGVGEKTSRLSSLDQKFLRPMPYNEKLRLGGKENSLAIAQTQVSTKEVLRGRYRKNCREYPVRRIESLGRRKIDIDYDFPKSSGLHLTTRKYAVRLTDQDRFVAEMAVAASGSLSLLGHNIHVVGEKAELVRREQVNTRRKQMIEEVTYDVKNKYELVKKPVKQEISESSDSSSEEERQRRSSRFSAGKKRQKKRRIDERWKLKKTENPKQVISEEKIKSEAADEVENTELSNGYEQDFEVGLNIWISRQSYNF